MSKDKDNQNADNHSGEITVYSPVSEHSGVVAGVVFVEGKGTVSHDNEGAINYFRRHGYQVGGSRRGDHPSPEGVQSLDGTGTSSEDPATTRDADALGHLLDQNPTIADLRSWAKAHTISIPAEAKTKDEITAVLQAANEQSGI